MLSKSPSLPPYYPALSNFLETNHLTDHSPQSLRQAVMAIRKSKLPDPSITPNNGSFFANPIVGLSVIETIKNTYPDVPNWEMDEGQYKLSAAWLIEQSGYGDYYDKETGMATWPGQPLVFINREAKSTADLINFRDKILVAVQEKFNISLKQEPEFRP